MAKNAHKDTRRGVALIGGGRLERLGFEETIKSDMSASGFKLVELGDPMDPADRRFIASASSARDQVVVVVMESCEADEIADTMKLVNILSPRTVIIALRNPEAVLQLYLWPTNVHAFVVWAEVAEKMSVFLHLVAEGLSIFDPEVINWDARSTAVTPTPREGKTLDRHFTVKLTRREEQVASEICQGATNDTIAEHLGIKVNTVNTHVNSLFQKLGVHNRTGVAVWFVTNNH